jgi:hypothetical protein
MAPITMLFRKIEMFECTIEYQTTWEDIAQAFIFINPIGNWSFMFTLTHLN